MHQSLSTEERQKMLFALRGNAEDKLTILTDRRDTSFAGTTEYDPTDEEVISAIRSIPCHY